MVVDMAEAEVAAADTVAVGAVTEVVVINRMGISHRLMLNPGWLQVTRHQVTQLPATRHPATRLQGMLRPQ